MFIKINKNKKTPAGIGFVFTSFNY